MKRTLIFLLCLLTKSLMGEGSGAIPVPPPVPGAIECRFGGLLEDGHIGLDQLVDYPLIPESGIFGDFEPYTFHIAVYAGRLTVEVYLEGEPISGIQIPFINVVNLPIGATIFGLSTAFHPVCEDFISLQYECVKVL